MVEWPPALARRGWRQVHGPSMPACRVSHHRVRGQPIGYIQYHLEGPGQAGLDMMLLPGFRDRGLGPRAARVMVAHLRLAFGWEDITVDPAQDNPRAIRAWEKAGFVIERQWPDHPDGAGAPHAPRATCHRWVKPRRPRPRLLVRLAPTRSRTNRQATAATPSQARVLAANPLVRRERRRQLGSSSGMAGRLVRPEELDPRLVTVLMALERTWPKI